MKIRFLTSLLLTSAFLPSCAMDEGKGEEQDALDIYESKTDSFRNPTEHGQLLFGVPQSAQLSEDEGFHAWDFDLSGDAQVSIATKITKNLDTVMYLYKFNENTGRYGSYKFKNDDANKDTVASELVKDLDAGNYRVLVKGFKSQLRGKFDVLADCDGAGCDTGSCDVGTIAGLDFDNGDSCGELFSDALSGEAAGENSTTVTLDERCSLPEHVAGALEQYVIYFGGLDAFNDAFDFTTFSGNPIEVDVDWQNYDNGSTYVTVDGGGDEAAMDYLINGDGQVIAHYQHNQSPEHTLYCDGGIEFLEDGECFFEYVSVFPHDPADERHVDATVTLATLDSIDERAAEVAVQTYVAELGLSDTEDILVGGWVWDLGGVNSAGTITVEAAGEDAFTYELAAFSNTQLQFTVKRGNAKAAYDCIEL